MLHFFREVQRRAAQEMAFMASACSGRTIGQHTPSRPLIARLVREKLAVDVHHAVLSIFLAVRNRFPTL